MSHYTTLESMYPHNKCHFCQTDFLFFSLNFCQNDYCRHDYTVGNEWVEYKIENYSFRVGNNFTHIYDHRSSKLMKVNFPVLITLENYLQVAEKCKKLQVFA